MDFSRPTILPLGDAALLVRFADRLDAGANLAALRLAAGIEAAPPPGLVEVTPNLVSVLLHYDPRKTSFRALAGEVGLALSASADAPMKQAKEQVVSVKYGGAEGPDLDEVAGLLGMDEETFVAAHNQHPLRVLAVGFAPGFVYCGMHTEALDVPRRREVRRMVPAGSVLFAARQTAIAATDIPTGWHVVGRTELINFDPDRMPPSVLSAGDSVRFRVAT